MHEGCERCISLKRNSVEVSAKSKHEILNYCRDIVLLYNTIIALEFHVNVYCVSWNGLQDSRLEEGRT